MPRPASYQAKMNEILGTQVDRLHERCMAPRNEEEKLDGLPRELLEKLEICARINKLIQAAVLAPERDARKAVDKGALQAALRGLGEKDTQPDREE